MNCAASAPAYTFRSPDAENGLGLPLMSLPKPECLSRKYFANDSAAAERALSQISIPSSLIEKATRSPAPGFALVQAALSALMIGPSAMRVSAAGVCGDWPCLAERMIRVRFCSPAALIASTIEPILLLM